MATIRILLRRRHQWRQFHHPLPLLPSFLPPYPQTLTLTPFSTTHGHTQRNRRRRRTPKTSPPPEPSPSEISAAIAALPPRFTPADLTRAMSLHRDPLLSLHLLTHWTHQPRFRPPYDPSPFLLALNQLGSARLLPSFHSAASLSLSLLPPSLPLFHTLLYHYLHSRHLPKAIHIFTLMRKSPAPPTLSTYNLLFTALLNLHRPTSNPYLHHLNMPVISSLFRHMLADGIAPDIVALNSVVRGYAQSLHLNDALRVFHQMAPVYGVEPDELTYGYLVEGLAAQGRTRNAMEVFGEMRGKGMRAGARAGSALASALAVGGEVGAAVGVVWEVVEMGRAVDFVALRAVVEEMCRVGRGEEAEGFVGELREREVVDGRTYRELLERVRDLQDGNGDRDLDW